jgi:tRNA-dihydrouridine synthase
VAGRLFSPPAGEALRDLVLRHYEAMLDHYGPIVGSKAARKHLGWYMERAGTPLLLRQAVLTETRPSAVTSLLRGAFPQFEERVAA